MNADLTTPNSAPQDERRPLLSIITVCRNAETTIVRALQSLAEQTFDDWEWIMVDGASTDETLAKASVLAGKGKRQQIISEPDGGIYEAMNKGLRAATGRYVHFLNTDDAYADSHVLQDVAAELARVPEVDFLYGNILVQCAGQADVLEIPPPPGEAKRGMVCGCLPHQGSFARLDLFFGELGLFNESLRTASDYQWMLRAVSMPSLKLHYIDRVIAAFSADGASSRLEDSLPESFKVLNECIEFQQALSLPSIIAEYQRNILELRIHVRDICARHDSDRKKLAKARLKQTELRAKLDQLRQEKLDAKAKQRPRSWLARWLHV